MQITFLLHFIHIDKVLLRTFFHTASPLVDFADYSILSWPLLTCFRISIQCINLLYNRLPQAIFGTKLAGWPHHFVQTTRVKWLLLLLLKYIVLMSNSKLIHSLWLLIYYILQWILISTSLSSHISRWSKCRYLLLLLLKCNLTLWCSFHSWLTDPTSKLILWLSKVLNNSIFMIKINLLVILHCPLIGI